MIYSVNNLKDTKKRPSNKHPIYSAFRGPNGNESVVIKLYKGQKLLSEKSGSEPYNPNEPLYLYHGPRACVEKTTDDENKTFIADSLFRPKRKYFNNDDASSLLDINRVKQDMSELMLEVYSDEEAYKRCCMEPKVLYKNL